MTFKCNLANWQSQRQADVKCRFQQSQTSEIVHRTDQSSERLGYKEFAWERNWYPVAISADVDGSKPIPVTLLGKKLVLWEVSEGEWSCVSDRCAHRYAPLSEGRVQDGDIQCAYHGWQYNSKGQCTRIPQAEDASACCSSAASVEAFPTRTRAGAVWVWPDSSATAAVDSSLAQPSIDTVLEDLLEYIDWYIRDFPYGYAGLTEMLLDPSHCPFTLHGIGLFNRDQGKPMPSTLTECNTEGPTARISVECARAFRPAGHPYDATVTFNSPCHITHDFVGANGHVIHGMYILPVAPGRSRLFYWHKAGSPGGASLDRLKSLRAPFGAGKGQLQRLVAAAEQFCVAYERCKRHMYLHPIFEAVGGLLHGQEQNMRGGESQAGFYMPSSADLLVTKFYAWLLGSAGGGPAWPPGTPPLPPPQTDREALLSRRHQHVANCPSCQTMLALNHRVHLAATVGSLLGLTAMVLCITFGSPWYLCAAALALAFWSWKKRSQSVAWGTQFGFVDYVHANRN
ncbi:g7593 [Coccomyxa elongata]